MKQKIASIVLYSLIGVLIMGISFKILNYSYFRLLSMKKQYLTEITSFSLSEINNIILDSKDNGTPEVNRNLSYTIPFNYNETISITSTSKKNFSNTKTDFNITFCYHIFPGSTKSICKNYTGTGDLN